MPCAPGPRHNIITEKSIDEEFQDRPLDKSV